MRTFVITIGSPDDIVKATDVSRALRQFIERNDEDAEKYGYELAGYSVEVAEAGPRHLRMVDGA